MSELERIEPYLGILLEGRPFEIYPKPAGIEKNVFEYVDRNGSHLKTRNAVSRTEYYVPLALIEFVNPSPSGFVILRLFRKMELRGSSFV